MRKVSLAVFLLLSASLFLSCGDFDNLGDDLAPTTPADLALTPGPARMDVSWSASEDDGRVLGYRLYRDGARITETAATSYSDVGLGGDTEYCYRVSAVDDTQHESPKTLEKCETTLPDTEPPTPPAGLSATVVSDSEISLSWTASTDNSSLSGYRIYRDGALVAAVTATSYRDSGLSPSTLYCYRVSAVDSSGNESGQSSQVCKTTSTGTVTGLVANALSSSRIDLSWTASTDSGASGYNLYRNGTFLATTAGTGYSDTGLASGTQYCYRVHIKYSSGMESVAYSEVCAWPLSWSITTVDSTTGADVGQYSSLALDNSGNVHISYVNTTTPSSLKYATNSSGAFIANTIDAPLEDVGEYSSITADGNNVIHISYLSFDGSWYGLKYANNISGVFSSTIVDASFGANTGLYTSIVTDGLNNAHISYYDESAGDLKYAVGTPGSWLINTVDSAGDVGRFTSIATRGSTTHISYYDNTDKDLKYASGSLGSWTVSIIDNATASDGEDSGTDSSIAVDSNNKVHISYYQYVSSTEGKLKYATNASGSWVITTIDGIGDVGRYTSIALDAGNRIHISYYDVTNRDLKYATKDSSGQWVISTVDSTGDVGGYSSLAVGSDGRAHISYYDATNGDLKYAVAGTTY